MVRHPIYESVKLFYENFYAYYETEIFSTHIISLHLKILNSKNETVTFPYTAEVSKNVLHNKPVLAGGGVI